MKKTRQDYFGIYLRYTSVAHSLWRSYECERFSKEELKPPVLDLGCGDGFFAQTVFGHLDTGIDMDEGEVSRAVKRGTYDKAMVVDATKMPFKNGSFNTVISNCVMEHIPDIEKAISEVHRVLKPGGRLIITVPSECFDNDSFFQKIFKAVGFNQAAQWYNRALNLIAKHYHVRDQKSWKKWFEKAGLKLEKSEYIMGLKAYHAFERWLIPAIPSKFWKAWFKRWVLLPRFWVPPVAKWWFKDLMTETESKGVCYFFVARKAKGTIRRR